MRPAFNCLAVVCFSLLSLATAAHAQSAKTECPTITVDCPAQIIKPGEPATVTANIAAADSTANLTYSWTISAGTITAGQGTPTITVDTTGTAGQTLTATVDVGGLDSSCQRAASCSFRYEMLVSRRFDKYGDLAFVDEKKRLDYFAERLKDESDAQGYILVYSRRGAPAGEAKARAARAKEYLVAKLGIDEKRLVTIDGGAHERLAIELWITPQGGRPPLPVDDQGDEVEGN